MECLTRTKVMMSSQPNSCPPSTPLLPKQPDGSAALPTTAVGVMRPARTRLPRILPKIWNIMYRRPFPMEMWPVSMVARVT